MLQITRYLPGISTMSLAMLMVLAVAGDAWGCPTCKNALGEESSHIVNGYFWSIIFMMSMPFLIFTGLSLYFYILVVRDRALKRRQAEQLAHAAASSAPAGFGATVNATSMNAKSNGGATESHGDTRPAPEMVEV